MTYAYLLCLQVLRKFMQQIQQQVQQQMQQQIQQLTQQTTQQILQLKDAFQHEMDEIKREAGLKVRQKTKELEEQKQKTEEIKTAYQNKYTTLENKHIGAQEAIQSKDDQIQGNNTTYDTV